MPSSFKIVYVPSDLSKSLEEWDIEIPENDEIGCLVTRLQKHFRKTEGANDPAQMEVFKKQLMEHLTPEQTAKVDPSMLQNFMAMGSLVDAVPLIPNKKALGYVGVNMYVDDRGVSKGLETNRRATSLAQMCGRSVEVLGDAFLARFYDDDDKFRRINFTLAELPTAPSGPNSDPNAPLVLPDWMRLAREAAAQSNSEQGETAATLKQLQASASSSASSSAGSGGGAGGAGGAGGGGGCAVGGCSKPGTLRCSRCKVVRYCSSACQRGDWKSHKKTCVPAPAAAAPGGV